MSFFQLGQPLTDETSDPGLVTVSPPSPTSPAAAQHRHQPQPSPYPTHACTSTRSDPTSGILTDGDDMTRAPSPEGENGPAPQSTSKPQSGETLEGDVASSEDSRLARYKKSLLTEQALLASRGLESVKSLPLAWKNLSVRGTGGAGEILYGATVGAILQGPYGSIQDKKRMKKLQAAKDDLEENRTAKNEHTLAEEARAGAKAGKSGKKKSERGLGKGERYLIHDFSGVVKSGEMLLVVGRPGSGCTTFLKAVSGLTSGFAGIDGEIMYGSLRSQSKDFKPYKGQVIFTSEDDIHFPNLQVGRTLDFALRNNTPDASARMAKEEGGEAIPAREYEDKAKANLLSVFGLEHTHDTKVGDAYVRGVSGGERKRVSIAEVLTNRASIQAWDNATRGLDANTALEYAKVMRTLSDVQKNTTLVSLYQAGNQIYKQFDKVLVIAEGQIIYYGLRRDAQGYFEDMGFECMDGANVADFLTGVTVPKERKVRQSYESRVPNSVSEFARRYRESDIARRMAQELEDHLAQERELEAESARLRDMVQREKHKWAFKSRPETLSIFGQIKYALLREYQQRWGDKWTFWARQCTTLIQSFIVGSLFYMMPLTTGGIFTRGGAIFLTLLYPSLISLSETTGAFVGRSVLAKHKAFSLYRPTALVLAQTIADLPILFVQIIIFLLPIYWMGGFKKDAGSFWLFFLFTYITTICTTAFFRFIGSSQKTFQNASKFSGLAFSILVTYAGYIIPTPSMKVWASWIRWLSPFYYSFEVLMTNEFAGQQFDCIPNQLVPYGPGYTAGRSQGCAFPGAQPGSTTVDGDAYIQTALKLYSSHRWRNFGILVAFWIFFVAVTCFATERLPAAGSTKSLLYYKRGGGRKFYKAAAMAANGNNEERQEEKKASGKEPKQDNSGVEAPDAVFTWKDLTYTVKSGGKDLVLLDKVSGFCKAGTLTALMGSSGAGKTTLLDVLAQRKDEGEVVGEVLVNGRPLNVAFQRTTGYCEQLDIHLPQATVREALEFSALLRQPRSISDKEKIAYVDTIIDLLELHDIEDALIGVPGAGLGIEQRKRLTIGVELVSKPTLLFLDEPTSGLDGQSSFLIVSFLRKLAAAGQAILCTIHQPSASLFAEFDSLLLMKAGGRVVYFGKIEKLATYFESEGVTIPKDANPAEFMIDVVSGDLSEDRDWAEIWKSSDACKIAASDLEELKSANKDKTSNTEEEKDEFASTTAQQLRIVTRRASLQLWRDTDYVVNKVMLHVGSALFNSLWTFWKINNTTTGLQNRLFTTFQFIFVAPGVIAQVQPKFIANRDVYEAREKKAKLYSWQAFVFAEIIAEIPYLLVCAFLYWVCWYPVVGFSLKAHVAGPVFLQMVFYEFLYTGIGQGIAAYAPSAYFASLVNPLVISVLVTFSGVLIPYSQIQAFWKYWLYYLNPFNYLMGGLLVFPIWNVNVSCSAQELGRFTPPAGQTCGQYLEPFLARTPGYLVDPSSKTQCEYCIYSKGSEYLATLNLLKYHYGWRDIGITALFVVSSYSLTFVLMKLRTKKTKTAKSK